ncbi:MAG: clan AA aspartic protease [Cyanobacteria bacterium J06634_6]
MILGRVNDGREAIVQIAVLNDHKKTASIEGVVDTGYTGDLMLPMAIVEKLGLVIQGIQQGVLGDGSSRAFEVYSGLVIWDGNIRKVEINAAETGALIGMGLLESCKLEIVAKPGGEVRITPLVDL